MTLKRSDRFQLELNTLVRKLRAHTLDSEERERVAEILLNNTADESPNAERIAELSKIDIGAVPA